MGRMLCVMYNFATEADRQIVKYYICLLIIIAGRELSLVVNLRLSSGGVSYKYIIIH